MKHKMKDGAIFSELRLALNSGFQEAKVVSHVYLCA